MTACCFWGDCMEPDLFRMSVRVMIGTSHVLTLFLHCLIQLSIELPLFKWQQIKNAAVQPANISCWPLKPIRSIKLSLKQQIDGLYPLVVFFRSSGYGGKLLGSKQTDVYFLKCVISHWSVCSLMFKNYHQPPF